MDLQHFLHFSLLLFIHSAEADQNEYRLVRDILYSYDKRIRPSLNASQPLNVTFGLALSQIIDVDEKNQVLTTNCWLNQMWTDYGLRWDPAKYGGIRIVRLPFTSVWKPDIFLYNNADVSTYFSSISSNMIVTSDGNVTWLSMVIFKSSCPINVRYFPFDEQNCSMTFASWTYDGFQLNLMLTTHEGDISNYIPNSEWDLQKLYVERNVVVYSCCAEPYPDITFYIHIRRRPLFYIFNMVLPCILITLVALLGFYIPSDSGEKVTMGITTLLSMTVFMMLVAENMPPTSNVLPLIGIYYGITICIVSFATGMTVFTLNIHHKGDRGKGVPDALKKIFLGVFAKILCLKLEATDGSLGKVTYTPEQACSGNKHYIPFRLSAEADIPRSSEKEMNPKVEQHGYSHYEVKIDGDMKPSNGTIPSKSTRLFYSSQSTERSTETGMFEQNFSNVLQKVYHTIEKNEFRLLSQDKRDAIKLEWQQLALVVDRLLLSIFVLVTLTITCALMLQGPLSQT